MKAAYHQPLKHASANPASRPRLLVRALTDGKSIKEVMQPKQGEDIKVIVVFIATDDQRLDIDLAALHSKPRTGSDIIVRGVVLDRAAVTFKGLIDIKKGAKQAKAFLRADVLLLDEKARADLVPSLNINENEVQAGHGATVGRINDEQLFYLMSRGLSKEKAVELLASGFLSSATGQLSIANQAKVRRVLKAAYEKR